jgi:hypothetical protein
MNIVMAVSIRFIEHAQAQTARIGRDLPSVMHRSREAIQRSQDLLARVERRRVAAEALTAPDMTAVQ